MTIYTITVVNRKFGWIAHVETYSNAQQAKEGIDHLEQKWNGDNQYLMQMHTTQIRANN